MTPELSEGQRAAFFKFIADDPSCSTKAACDAVGLKRSLVKRLRREDPAFDDDYRTARGYGQERVMGAMVKLAIEGVEEPLVSAGKLVTDAEGQVVTVRKYSDKLLEALYKSGTQEGQVLLGPKATLDITGEVRHTVQRGVELADVAKVMLAAGVDLQALAAGDEIEDAEVVDETGD